MRSIIIVLVAVILICLGCSWAKDESRHNLRTSVLQARGMDDNANQEHKLKDPTNISKPIDPKSDFKGKGKKKKILFAAAENQGKGGSNNKQRKPKRSIPDIYKVLPERISLFDSSTNIITEKPQSHYAGK